MGRLVFDNLKKVILYLMPVGVLILTLVYFLTEVWAGWHVHGVHHRLCKRIPRNAVGIELVSSSLFLYHERRRHVHLVNV
jgi:hypothetical protein